MLAHFKGHHIAGYGGAIKQLGMGCAARGGKLAMHLRAKPFIIAFKCKQCHACEQKCPADAITIGRWSRIDHKKCIGCASCLAVCPHKAIFFNFLKVNLAGKFRERLAEYAYAAQLGQKNVYINFVFNITAGCDCEGHAMKTIAPDVGALASSDPVALDAACHELLDKETGKKVLGGRSILDYAERIGLGHKNFELVTIS